MKKLLFFAALAIPLAVGASPAVDFNGDGTDDIAIFRASSDLWSVRGITRVYFGSAKDAVLPGDYDGSGTASAAIFRASSGLWAVRGVTRLYFGSKIDEPKPGDYNGDGSDDVCIFRKSTGLWAIRGITRVYYGEFGDLAIPGKQRRLTVTGQFTEYSSGDDGDYRAGAAFNFQTLSIGGDLVTIDHNTGLMWASDGNEEGCNWGNQTDWYAAIDSCNNLVFAGYSDWRLPNLRELQSIADYRIYTPSLDPAYFPNPAPYNYWSSTTEAEFGGAWFVSFMYGTLNFYGKSSSYSLRAVRGGL